MSNLVLSPAEIKLFQALLDGQVNFMIVGQTAAILQGALTTTQDIDLWIEDLGSDSFHDAIKKAGATYIAPAVAGMNPPMLAPKDFASIDLVAHMHGLNDFAEEFKNALVIEVSNLSLKVLSLERIIVSKKAANREKDRVVLPALEATLAAKQAKE